RPGDVDEPDAALLLRDAGSVAVADLRAAVADDRPRLPGAAAEPRLPLLRRRARWRSAALAAPVLALRPPRGLHHHPARVRDRDLDHPDLLEAEDDRLSAGRARGAARRLHRLRRLGASHV